MVSELQRYLLCLRFSRSETGRPLQAKQPAMSTERVVGLYDKGSFEREEAFSGVELCLEKNPSLLYGEGELTVPEAKDVSSKTRKLPQSMI